MKEFDTYGLPSRQRLRIFEGYVMAYDQRNRIPFWVFEHLTPEKLAAGEDSLLRNQRPEFKKDPHIHHFFRSYNADYKQSGYDRGHLAAAGNHRCNKEELDDTFFLSNMAPQVGSLVLNLLK
ncbi:ENDOG [Cordylochernes scorpioides]|uniref:Endonuclease n=1 Tax=Cordylochernes scorpioides TaxID=51811 RepID=A0ABY6LSD9_9ARAC|nr:ENDOG [Cordylochernes scorpioides]